MNLEIPYDYKNLRKINLGLTNNNYLIDIDDKQYIVRVPRRDLDHLFNRCDEQQVLKLLQDEPYILHPIYYEEGIQIVHYKPSLINFDDYHKPDKIKRVAQLMKQFHNSNILSDHNFDPIHQAKLYLKHAGRLDIEMKDYDELFKKVQSHSFKPTLCHNDWVAGNICYLNEQTYLIDFEYAGNNDKRFDIMSFVTENDLSDDEKKQFITHMYPDGISTEEHDILCMYRDMNNILWYLWAKMMHHTRDENIYDEIAQIKLKQLTQDYNKPLLFMQ